MPSIQNIDIFTKEQREPKSHQKVRVFAASSPRLVE